MAVMLIRIPVTPRRVRHCSAARPAAAVIYLLNAGMGMRNRLCNGVNGKRLTRPVIMCTAESCTALRHIDIAKSHRAFWV